MNDVAAPAGAALNVEIAAAFDEIADLLAFKGENAHRVRAYRQAARTLGGLRQEVSAMLSDRRALDDLPSIGKDLAGQIADFVATGRSERLAALRREIPAAAAALLRIPGIGPARAAAVHELLHVESPEQLAEAARMGRLRTVRGFGPRLEQKLLRMLERPGDPRPRFMRSQVVAVAQALVDNLKASPGVHDAQIAGSLRRGRDEVGDIDLVVTAAPQGEALARFAAGSRVERVLSLGTTRASVQLAGGLQVDIRAVPQASFGAALLYLTGSRAHDLALRRLAVRRGMKLNEYGLFRGARRIAGTTEAGVYEALGLPWIAPELREDRGELSTPELPRLVTLHDLRGDLHAHTSDSVGRDTLEAMAAAARQRGLEYLAVTDHAGRLTAARGLDPGRLSQQIDRIDACNAAQGASCGFTLLKGVVVDILEDGSLDLPDDLLARLDLVIGAVHAAHDLPRGRQTARLLRAMDHTSFSILAHPRGRMIGRRAAMDFDLAAVLAHARQRRCFVELDSQPRRLDLDDLGCRMAREAGVLVSIASDAHSTGELDLLAGGVLQARRGWLESGNVLNARSLRDLRALLAPTMARAMPGATGASGNCVATPGSKSRA